MADGASGSHLGDHDGYVVATAMSNGSLDQVVDDRGHVSISRHGIRDLPAGQLVEQAVTTNDDSVSSFDGNGSAVNLDIGRDAECSGENPVVGVLKCFFLPELSALDEFGRQAVVPGQLGQRTVMP
jgi:hypothetical protein